MRLPNGNRAIVNVEKLAKYCLNPDHPRGRHKARVFSRRLGLTAETAETLRLAILAASEEYEARETRADEFGRRFVLDFPMETDAGAAMVRTGWIILAGEDRPRLTSCFVM